MRNLLVETIGTLKCYEKTPTDVLWVGNGCGKYVISWNDFEAIANEEYDPGYGAQEVASDLVVVGADWWLSRWEYDGSEGWKFNSIPLKSKNPIPFTHVICPEELVGWQCIKDLEEKEQE